jgi:hypothetical protein
MCEIFDRQYVPLTIETTGFRTWPEACRHPHYRKRIQVLITKRGEAGCLDFSLEPEEGLTWLLDPAGRPRSARWEVNVTVRADSAEGFGQGKLQDGVFVWQ